jgi:dTDP-4-dehydrorhamnose 3,5-epimerase
MQRLPNKLDGPVLLAPVVHGDERGFFLECYRSNTFAEFGAPDAFVQDNHSRSRAGVARGMHFQPGQAKLIRCVRGAIYDVVVDIRLDSPQFGRWEGVRLDDVDHHQLFIPDGFAHGFCVLSDVADVTYKVSTYYDPERESGFAFDDSAVGIDWPQGLIVSERDRRAPSLAEVRPSLAAMYEAASDA